MGASVSLENRPPEAWETAFIQAFITALTAAGFTAQKIAAKLALLVSAFAEEDRYYMMASASEIVAQREQADQVRDRFYTRLRRLILAWAGSGMEGLDALRDFHPPVERHGEALSGHARQEERDEFRFVVGGIDFGFFVGDERQRFIER